MSRPALGIAVRAACAVALFAVACSGSPATAGSAGGDAAASPVPRLYRGVMVRRGAFVRMFAVRPPTVGVSCADGGSLVITWRRWTRNSASGRGWTQPCSGAGVAISVYASRPVDGYLTRLSVRYDGSAPSRLGLAHLGGRLSWLALEQLADSSSGQSPWPA